MDENKIKRSFIREWIERKKSEPEFDQSIIGAIEQNLGGVNNENLDEASLLQALIELANKVGKNA